MSACECATNIYICDNVDIRTHWMCVTLPLIAVFVNFTHSRIPWREPQKSKHVQNRKKTTGIHSTIYVHNKIDCWLISSFPFMRFLSPFLRCTGFELLTLIFRQYKEYTICLPSAPAPPSVRISLFDVCRVSAFIEKKMIVAVIETSLKE